MLCEAIMSALYLTQFLPLQSCSQNGGAGCDSQKDLFFLSWRVRVTALGEDEWFYIPSTFCRIGILLACRTLDDHLSHVAASLVTFLMGQSDFLSIVETLDFFVQ